MEKTLKSDIAYEMIRDLILSGKLLPGTRLVICELEEKLGLGKGPIRDALMRLGKSGLVENIPYKGAVVKPLPSLNEIKCFYNLRLIAERTLALEAMKKITDQDLIDLEALIEQTRQKQNADSEFFKLDRAFHIKLYSIAKQEHLEDIVNTIMDHIEVFLCSYLYTYYDRNKIIDGHQQILAAIRAKDERLLMQAMKKNILIGLVFVNRYLSKLSWTRISPGNS